MSPADQATLRLRAAAYLRMSTEHQQYSICGQREVIREFARQRNLEMVKVYSDEGKSGLRIQGRAALAQLIRDALARNINFARILVYEVSRWGRFQDPDEAAHYEFLCRQAGVMEHYWAEPFENDGGLASAIAKNFKRAMAGEFSQAAFYDVMAMVCSGGGGRVDYGSLKFFHSFWPSDNTDPRDRVKIQWGFSHFFSATTIAAHVTRLGDRPLKFARTWR